MTARIASSRPGLFLAAAALSLLFPGAAAQAQRKVLTPVAPAGAQPWSQCSDREEALVDNDRKIVIAATCGGRAELWLGAVEFPASQPRKITVLDRLAIRPLLAGEKISIGPYCTLRGKSLDWAAIYRLGRVKNRQAQTLRPIAAWVRNAAGSGFESVPQAMLTAASCRANLDE